MTELMVATMILSIGVLGLFGAFRFIARSTFISRASSLATNLGQERIESLKNLSYYSLQITTTTGTDATVTPARSRSRGEHEAERGLAVGAGDVDPTAVVDRDLAHEREAEAGTLLLRGVKRRPDLL